MKLYGTLKGRPAGLAFLAILCAASPAWGQCLNSSTSSSYILIDGGGCEVSNGSPYNVGTLQIGGSKSFNFADLATGVTGMEAWDETGLSLGYGGNATINAGSVHINGHGDLEVVKNATLNINTTAIGGFTVGRWAGDPTYGGAILVEPNAKLIVTNAGNLASFGYGGAAVLRDKSLLRVTSGISTFYSGFTIVVEGNDLAQTPLEFIGAVNIQKGVNVVVFEDFDDGGGFQNRVNLEDVNGELMSAIGVITAEDDKIFINPLFKFTRSANGINMEYVGASAAINDLVSSMASGLTGNFAQGAALLTKVLEGPGRASRQLVSSLQVNLNGISALLADNPAKAETALRQLIGEDSLTALNAQVDTLAQTSGALSKHIQGNHNYFRQAPAAGYGETLNRVWAGGFGSWNKQKDRDQVEGYDYDTTGLILGYEREAEDISGLVVGVNGSWSFGQVKNNNGLSETDIKSFGLGLYATYELGGGYFMDGNLGYGTTDNETKTTLAFRDDFSTESDFSGRSYTAGLNFGYNHELDPATYLTPSLGLQYTHVKQDGWSEKGSNPGVITHWFEESKRNFLEIPFNLKLASTLETGFGPVTPEARLGLVYAAIEPKSELRMGFVGSNESITITGLSPGKTRFTAGAGAKAQVSDQIDVFAGYDLEIKSGYTGHSFSGVVGYSF